MTNKPSKPSKSFLYFLDVPMIPISINLLGISIPVSNTSFYKCLGIFDHRCLMALVTASYAAQQTKGVLGHWEFRCDLGSIFTNKD